MTAEEYRKCECCGRLGNAETQKPVRHAAAEMVKVYYYCKCGNSWPVMFRPKQFLSKGGPKEKTAAS